jgi:hypothetical protein
MPIRSSSVISSSSTALDYGAAGDKEVPCGRERMDWEVIACAFRLSLSWRFSTSKRWMCSVIAFNRSPCSCEALDAVEL